LVKTMPIIIEEMYQPSENEQTQQSVHGHT
jgi:hypothetical protein